MMKKLFALLFCLAVLFAAAAAEETSASAPILELHQMAIGYADSYYIRCGDIEIMIDGGNPIPGSKNDDIVNYLRAVGAGTLDAHIITHWHLDHCEKLNAVLAEFGDAETVVYSPSVELPAIATGEGVTIQISPLANGTYRQMKIHDVIQIGDLTITCTGPEKLSYGGTQNKDSLNFVIQYGERRMLFTGDYGQSNEINKYFPELCRNVDVLKFPHHGGTPFELGYYASRIVAPNFVLVPSGNNNYMVYRFFEDNGVQMIRDNVLTQRAGHVVILTDGGDYLEAKTQQNPEDYAPKAE